MKMRGEEIKLFATNEKTFDLFNIVFITSLHYQNWFRHSLLDSINIFLEDTSSFKSFRIKSVLHLSTIF